MLSFGVPSTLAPVSAAAEPLDGFLPAAIPLRAEGLRDLGVTDANGDGHMDVFTTNHSAPENLLLGAGDGTFQQAIEATKLTQDERFPNLIYQGPSLPDPPSRKVQIVWWRSVKTDRLLLRFPSGSHTEGRLTLFSPIRVEAGRGVKRKVTTRTLDDGIFETVLQFRAKGRTKMKLDVEEIGLPVSVDLDASHPVVVGIPGVPAPKGSFRLFRRDRHAAAWADAMGGPRQEVALVRGGMKGKALEYPVEVYQELKVFEDGRYVNRGTSLGLKQAGCSSNSAEWVDATNDGKLDLFIICNHGQPNRLFVREGKRFVNRARALGLDDPVDPVLWLDKDGDNDQDMLTVRHGEVFLYENRPSGFKKKTLLTIPAASIRNLVLHPSSVNMSVTVVARSRSGTITFDRDGIASWIGFESFGLPTSLLHASYVDHDNDGDIDVFTHPGGLFTNLGVGDYVESPVQPPIPDGPVENIRVAWFDANEDGRLDFLGAILPTGTFPLRWKVSFALNQVQASNHWLHLELRGPRGNASAIGTVIEATTPRGTFRTGVGAFEASRNSQGHHQVYLGLGPIVSSVQLRIRWPDGSIEEVETSQVDRLMDVSYDTP